MLDASLMHTPIKENTKAAKSIQSDCMWIPALRCKEVDVQLEQSGWLKYFQPANFCQAL